MYGGLNKSCHASVKMGDIALEFYSVFCMYQEYTTLINNLAKKLISHRFSYEMKSISQLYYLSYKLNYNIKHYKKNSNKTRLRE